MRVPAKPMGSLCSDDLARAFEEHRRLLWGVGYRMTGDAAEADDLVQEVFLRALRARPDPGESLRPWLVRVAVNLARDHLRRRRRLRYDGPWLPAPVPSSTFEGEAAAGPAARYDLAESATFAFLLALEALTPGQRAVLLLRDVLDYSVRETAEALGMSEANAKTTHHRARRAMEAYDRRRRPPTRELAEKTRRVLERFLDCLRRGDARGVEELLAEQVRHVSDAGGEFAAARAPIVGRAPVLRLLLSLAERLGPTTRFEPVEVNGLPALSLRIAAPPPGYAPRALLRFELDEEGRIAAIHTVLASRKLAALPAR